MNKHINLLSLSGIFSILLLMTACTTQMNQGNTGRVVMTVTDAAASMGAVTSVKMTVGKVSFHNDADGWIDVATPQRTYDLVALKASGKNALLADISLSPSRYDQIQLEVSSVTVTDANGTHDAKMPLNALRLNGEVVVLSKKTATVSFDFIADKSIYKTIDGRYVFAPAIKLESRTDADANTAETGDVRVSGGTVQSSTYVGMDSLGNMVVDGNLPPFLKINADGTISGTEAELNTNTTAIPNQVNYQDPNSRILPEGPINPDDLNSRIEP